MKVKRLKNGKRIFMIFLLMALALTGCTMSNEPGPLNPKGSVAQDQLWLIQLSLGIMFGVLAVVFILLFIVIVRFRKRRGQTGIPKQVEGNHKLEIIWTVIPIVLLLILAVPTVQQTFALAKDYSEHKNAVQIKVTAHQFWWEFEYKDYDIVTAQDLYIPVGKKIFVELTSADVAHSFWIPALAGKTDTLPGLVNKMYFDALEPGVYKGKCAELCGQAHALMDFKVIAVTQDEFDAWIAEQTAPTADMSVTGEEVFKAKGCINCHAIAPNGSSAGPNLNNFANREKVAGIKDNTDEWIAKWLDNPSKMKPGTMMNIYDPGSDMKLTAEEIDALVEYLNSLNNKQQ